MTAIFHVIHTHTHSEHSTIYCMAFLSPWSSFECWLLAQCDAETLKQWTSVFLYFSWQLPHLDRGNSGLPAELQQTPGPSQSAHSATAPGTMFHTSVLVLVHVNQTAWGKSFVGLTVEVWASVDAAVISGYHCWFWWGLSLLGFSTLRQVCIQKEAQYLQDTKSKDRSEHYYSWYKMLFVIIMTDLRLGVVISSEHIPVGEICDWCINFDECTWKSVNIFLCVCVSGCVSKLHSAPLTWRIFSVQNVFGLLSYKHCTKKEHKLLSEASSTLAHFHFKTEF